MDSVAEWQRLSELEDRSMEIIQSKTTERRKDGIK